MSATPPACHDSGTGSSSPWDILKILNARCYSRSQIAATGEDGLQWISDVVLLNADNACRLPSFQTERGQKVPAAYKEMA